jgi:AraC-like DNA-binding protein
MKIDRSRFMCFPTVCPVQTARMAHVHDFHEFIVCTNSHGRQFAGNAAMPHRRGSVFCFPAGMTHYSSGEPDAPARAFVIWLPDSMFSPVSYGDQETCQQLRRIFHLARQGMNPLPLKQGTTSRILELTRDMTAEYQEGKPGCQAATRSLLQQIFLLITRDGGLGSGNDLARPPSHHEKIARVLQVLEGQFMDPVSIDDMARIAGMSRSHFHSVFQTAAGCTPIEYLTQVRIRAAQRLLRDSTAPIVQIALDCGFPSLSRFYVAFKALTHQTPRQVSRGSASSTRKPGKT